MIAVDNTRAGAAYADPAWLAATVRRAHSVREPNRPVAPATTRCCDPELDPPARVGEVDRRRQAWLAAAPASTVTRVAAELVADIHALTVRINALEKKLARAVRKAALHRLNLPGCVPLIAAA